MRVSKIIYNWFDCPPSLVAVRQALRRRPARILDISCGNHNATIIKRHFPECYYHGAHCHHWKLNERDKEMTDEFFHVDLEQNPDDLTVIEDGHYDAVICSHVLEHLTDPYRALRDIITKLALGGVLYIEVPSARSACLPRAKHGWYGVRGCLNFKDDPTHRTLVDLVNVRRLLRQYGLQVGEIRPRRLWRRVLFLPLYASVGFILRGYIPASVVWDVSGFAEILIGKKPGINGGLQ